MPNYLELAYNGNYVGGARTRDVIRWEYFTYKGQLYLVGHHKGEEIVSEVLQSTFFG